MELLNLLQNTELDDQRYAASNLLDQIKLVENGLGESKASTSSAVNGGDIMAGNITPLVCAHVALIIDSSNPILSIL